MNDSFLNVRDVFLYNLFSFLIIYSIGGRTIDWIPKELEDVVDVTKFPSVVASLRNCVRNDGYLLDSAQSGEDLIISSYSVLKTSSTATNCFS